MGENAPNSHNDLYSCLNGQMGFMPLAVRDLPFFVNNPKRLSSQKYTFAEVYLGLDCMANSWHFSPNFF
jgi:hypothetical protein